MEMRSFKLSDKPEHFQNGTGYYRPIYIKYATKVVVWFANFGTDPIVTSGGGASIMATPATTVNCTAMKSWRYISSLSFSFHYSIPGPLLAQFDTDCQKLCTQ